jgi:hypothetical protein
MSAPTTRCEPGEHDWYDEGPLSCLRCGVSEPSYTDGLRDAVDLMQATGPDVAALWKLHDAMANAAENSHSELVWTVLGEWANALLSHLPPRPSTPETTTP